MSVENPTTRAELIEALLIERFGHLHPEYRAPQRDRTAEIQSLRLVVDNEQRVVQEGRRA